jgi:hypothetical protein
MATIKTTMTIMTTRPQLYVTFKAALNIFKCKKQGEALAIFFADALTFLQ